MTLTEEGHDTQKTNNAKYKGETTMTIKKNDTSEQYDAGWRDAIEAFSEQWKTRPDDISREELIRSTNRLLILLHPDTENLTEEEISKRI